MKSIKECINESLSFKDFAEYGITGKEIKNVKSVIMRFKHRETVHMILSEFYNENVFDVISINPKDMENVPDFYKRTMDKDEFAEYQKGLKPGDVIVLSSIPEGWEGNWISIDDAEYQMDENRLVFFVDK